MKITPCILIVVFALAPTLHASHLNWPDDFDGAKKEAQRKNKLILMVVTAPDACPKNERMTPSDLETKVLGTSKFKREAEDRFVLLEIERRFDDVNIRRQSKKLREQAEMIIRTYKPEGAEQIFILDPEGKELMRTQGYWLAKEGVDFFESMKTKFLPIDSQLPVPGRPEELLGPNYGPSWFVTSKVGLEAITNPVAKD